MLDSGLVSQKRLNVNPVQNHPLSGLASGSEAKTPTFLRGSATAAANGGAGLSGHSVVSTGAVGAGFGPSHSGYPHQHRSSLTSSLADAKLAPRPNSAAGSGQSLGLRISGGAAVQDRPYSISAVAQTANLSGPSSTPVGPGVSIASHSSNSLSTVTNDTQLTKSLSALRHALLHHEGGAGKGHSIGAPGNAARAKSLVAKDVSSLEGSSTSLLAKVPEPDPPCYSSGLRPPRVKADALLTADQSSEASTQDNSQGMARPNGTTQHPSTLSNSTTKTLQGARKPPSTAPNSRAQLQAARKVVKQPTRVFKQPCRVPLRPDAEEDDEPDTPQRAPDPDESSESQVDPRPSKAREAPSPMDNASDSETYEDPERDMPRPGPPRAKPQSQVSGGSGVGGSVRTVNRRGPSAPDNSQAGAVFAFGSTAVPPQPTVTSTAHLPLNQTAIASTNRLYVPRRESATLATTATAQSEPHMIEPPDASELALVSAEERNEIRRKYFEGVCNIWRMRRKVRVRDTNQRVRFRCHLTNTILDVLRAKGYEETTSETEWDIGWMPRDWIRGVYCKVHLDSHQRVNHYRNFYEITRKDLLFKNVRRMRRTLQKEGKTQEAAEYDFMPDTYVLPGEYTIFVDAFKKSQCIWIMKPISQCQGRGIFLVDKLKAVSDWKDGKVTLDGMTNGNQTSDETNDDEQAVSAATESYIAQEYISRPLLIGGKKFDCRIYVLVPSYNPLTVWLCRDAFCRFSSTRFSMSDSDMANSFVHLTNVAVQKAGPDYDADSGGKWDIRSLKHYLMSKVGEARTNKLFNDIERVIVRALLAVQKIMISDENSFALYGYDILIDADLKVWLLEVNGCPSLTANTPHDYKLKFDMLSDALTIIDVEKRLTGNETQVGGWDLIYKNGFIAPTNHSSAYNSGQPGMKLSSGGIASSLITTGNTQAPDYVSKLGALNNREEQLPKLWMDLYRLQQQQSQQYQSSSSGSATGQSGTGQAAASGSGPNLSSAAANTSVPSGAVSTKPAPKLSFAHPR